MDEDVEERLCVTTQEAAPTTAVPLSAKSILPPNSSSNVNPRGIKPKISHKSSPPPLSRSHSASASSISGPLRTQQRADDLFTVNARRDHLERRPGSTETLNDNLTLVRIHGTWDDEPLSLYAGFRPIITAQSNVYTPKELSLCHLSARVQDGERENILRITLDPLLSISRLAKGCSISLSKRLSDTASPYIPSYKELEELYCADREQVKEVEYEKLLGMHEHDCQEFDIESREHAPRIRTTSAEPESAVLAQTQAEDAWWIGMMEDMLLQLERQLEDAYADLGMSYLRADVEDALVRGVEKREQESLWETIQSLREELSDAERRECVATSREQAEQEVRLREDTELIQVRPRLAFYRVQYEKLQRSLEEGLAKMKRNADLKWTEAWHSKLDELSIENEECYKTIRRLQEENQGLRREKIGFQHEIAMLSRRVESLQPFVDRYRQMEQKRVSLEVTINEMEERMRTQQSVHEEELHAKTCMVSALELQLKGFKEQRFTCKISALEKKLQQWKAQARVREKEAYKKDILTRKIQTLLTEIARLKIKPQALIDEHEARVDSSLSLPDEERRNLLKWLTRRLFTAIEIEVQWCHRPCEGAALIEDHTGLGNELIGPGNLSIYDALLQLRDTNVNPETEERRMIRLNRLEDEKWRVRLLGEWMSWFDEATTGARDTAIGNAKFRRTGSQAGDLDDAIRRMKPTSNAPEFISNGRRRRQLYTERHNRKQLANTIQEALSIDRSELALHEYPLLDRMLIRGGDIPNLLLQQPDRTIKLDWAALGRMSNITASVIRSGFIST